ncbi:4735_t:CDS:2 [Dentiscutata erythropus]|uniref:4735_t:CDS:1 n=1 Tax=Dentiscutata erythropus TaxID=1348616 RepID=A0A9N9I770_9GLOM|nr:4735_t:CDS:2 [Dentiscutata erythropus]
MSQQDEEKLREEPIDERIQETLDKIKDEDDEEKLFEELENEDDFEIANLRERRMEQMKQDRVTKLQEMRQNEHGSYTEIAEEKEILKITTTTKLCVVHFFHKEFRRCQIMDKHLTTIADRHFKTRFIKINVENAPFLVEKLAIKVLPCVISFIDGVSVDKIIGFDDLGNTDSFTTAALEFRLSQSGAITKQEAPKKQERKTIFGFADVNNDDDDDWD